MKDLSDFLFGVRPESPQRGGIFTDRHDLINNLLIHPYHENMNYETVKVYVSMTLTHGNKRYSKSAPKKFIVALIDTIKERLPGDDPLHKNLEEKFEEAYLFTKKPTYGDGAQFSKTFKSCDMLTYIWKGEKRFLDGSLIIRQQETSVFSFLQKQFATWKVTPYQKDWYNKFRSNHTLSMTPSIICVESEEAAEDCLKAFIVRINSYITETYGKSSYRMVLKFFEEITKNDNRSKPIFEMRILHSNVFTLLPAVLLNTRETDQLFLMNTNEYGCCNIMHLDSHMSTSWAQGLRTIFQNRDYETFSVVQIVRKLLEKT